MQNSDKLKAKGPDEISIWVLKKCVQELSEPIYIMFQESLNQGKLPETCKKANTAAL